MSAERMKSKFVRRLSSVVCRPSSVRPSMSQLSLNLLQWFLSNFGCCFSWAIRSEVYWMFEKNCFTIFFVYVNMGPNGRDNFKTLLLLQIAAKSFETCSEFSRNGPHKTTSGIFEILSFQFLTIFFENFKFTIVAYGSRNQSLNNLENERS